ncbi:sulfotransferase domain-containing protein [Spirulina sp. 06S082]|uniref:sulfotransferase domain-containing protein n=1 Tax=Spirulina sp. 06S082 TaxID=3110248 RepID=UPI002B1FC76D|nr:sulfotransferase domain-containing protein [Spirulina sp. 06S082]MEA5469175.1 sulfotransferase domain-containing protein [Spirulina sp. 06S082]
MIVFCCGLMRSGSTLQYKLTQTLVEKVGKGSGLGWLPSVPNKEDLFHRATESDRDNYYIVKIHGYSPDFGDLIRQNKGKAIYVYRDLRDVVTSFMSWRKCSFDAVIREQWLEKVMRDSKKWESLETIYISKYEVLMQNLEKEVLGIAEHLGISISNDLAKEVAEQCSIDRQKKKTELMQSKQQKIDSQNILHQNHISSGKSQRWLQELSASEIAYIEQKTAPWLLAHNYDLAYPNSVNRGILATRENFNLFVSDCIFNAKRTKGHIDNYLQSSDRN